MPILPMFPLGSVLLPHLPLRLRVFEPRYLIMLDHLVRNDTAEFGVVLIERGQEVGGGEQRFDLGTVAEIVSVAAQGGVLGLLARGRGRVRVQSWLADDPYPRAEVTPLPELAWDAGLQALLTSTERAVRRSLALASEFALAAWPADVALDQAPVVAAWQLAGAAPLSPLDHLALLAATSTEELLTRLSALCDAVAADLSADWPDQ